MDHTHTKQGSTQVRIITESEDQAWDNMVKEHPYGCVFQTSAFRKVICETFPHTKPFYLALVDADGNMQGGLPVFLVRSWLTGTRLVSLPFTFYSDPLVQSREEFERVFAAVLGIYREEGAAYVEIKARAATALLEGAEILTPVFYHKIYSIDLTAGLDEVWKTLHKDCIQRKIRQAERSGVEVRLAGSEGDVVSFWNLLVKTRRRLGLPPQNYSYFRNMWRYLTPAGLTDFLIAEKGGEMVGGINAFRLGDTVHLGYVANQTRYWSLGVDQALLWKLIQIAIDDGCKTLDLGKTSPFADGLITYKRRWGARESEAPCFYYPRPRGVSSLNNEQKLSHRVMTIAWRRLPGPMLRLGGRFAYRHLG